MADASFLDDDPLAITADELLDLGGLPERVALYLAWIEPLRAYQGPGRDVVAVYVGNLHWAPILTRPLAWQNWMVWVNQTLGAVPAEATLGVPRSTQPRTRVASKQLAPGGVVKKRPPPIRPQTIVRLIREARAVLLKHVSLCPVHRCREFARWAINRGATGEMVYCAHHCPEGSKQVDYPEPYDGLLSALSAAEAESHHEER
jgi:hypothetical protein